MRSFAPHGSGFEVVDLFLRRIAHEELAEGLEGAILIGLVAVSIVVEVDGVLRARVAIFPVAAADA